MDTGRSVEAMSPLWFAPRVRLCIVTINAARSTKLLKNVSAVWPRLAVLIFRSHVLLWALLSTQPLLQWVHWLFSSPIFINIQLFLKIASYIFSSKIIPEPSLLSSLTNSTPNISQGPASWDYSSHQNRTHQRLPVLSQTRPLPRSENPTNCDSPLCPIPSGWYTCHWAKAELGFWGWKNRWKNRKGSRVTWKEERRCFLFFGGDCIQNIYSLGQE